MGKKKIGKFTIPQHDNQLEKIAEELKIVGLDSSVSSFELITEQVKSDHGTIYDYLERLLDLEITHREEERVNRWIQQAKLFPLTTINEYDFSLQPSVDQVLVNELATCRFIEQGKNIMLLGPPGVGKTHLAVALGYEAVRKGLETRCMKLNEFIDAIQKGADDSLKRLFRALVGAKLLILDDVDYYATDDESGKFLFDVIKQRYEDKSSTIITSNKNPKAWDNLFGPDRTKAALDRLFDHHRAITINITGGQSYRVPRPLDQLGKTPSVTVAPPEKRFLKKVAGAFSRES